MTRRTSRPTRKKDQPAFLNRRDELRDNFHLVDKPPDKLTSVNEGDAAQADQRAPAVGVLLREGEGVRVWKLSQHGDIKDLSVVPMPMNLYSGISTHGPD